jgi:hypothetical protein
MYGCLADAVGNFRMWEMLERKTAEQLEEILERIGDFL